MRHSPSAGDPDSKISWESSDLVCFPNMAQPIGRKIMLISTTNTIIKYYNTAMILRYVKIGHCIVKSMCVGHIPRNWDEKYQCGDLDIYL